MSMIDYFNQNRYVTTGSVFYTVSNSSFTSDNTIYNFSQAQEAPVVKVKCFDCAHAKDIHTINDVIFSTCSKDSVLKNSIHEKICDKFKKRDPAIRVGTL